MYHLVTILMSDSIGCVSHPQNKPRSILQLPPPFCKEEAVSLTVIIPIHQATLYQPISFAAIPANSKQRASAARPRNPEGAFNKSSCRVTPRHFRKALLAHSTQTPLIQHVKIARIYAAVTLYHKLDRAVTSHITGFWPLAQQDRQPVIQMANADIFAFL